ncbi:MAG: sulfate ABC transporter permease subunit CysT, partial [Pusillimonas sp.]
MTAATLPIHRNRPSRVMPGFNITLGFTILYLSLIVLIPLSAIF